MDKEEIVYDHYKETCEICKNNEKERNKLFTIVCIIITFIFLLINAETSTIGMLYAWVKKNYNYDLTLSVETIQTLMGMLLLYYTIRYYQQCVYIERLYEYIHIIEKELSATISLDIVREGKEYLQDYPKILHFIWFIYSIVFPVLYCALVIMKIAIDLHKNIWDWNFYIQILLEICDIILILLYIAFLHKDNIFHRRNR